MANSFMQEEVVLGELTEWIYHKTGVIIAPDELCHIAEEMSVALKASKEKEKALQAKSMSYELDDMKNELLRALTQIGLAEEDVEKLAEECSELKLENKALHLEIENLKGGLVNAEGMPSEAKRVNLSPSIHTPSFHRHPIVIGTRCSISDSSSFTYADPQIRQIWHRT
ncbi:unnamed protein product [Sphagnum jensenii]|uniref:Uncharacterized protein n=1 Tax=Sphagnum jensenii TaxID=128206 RepID=A0ABP0V916_9BRYO